MQNLRERIDEGYGVHLELEGLPVTTHDLELDHHPEGVWPGYPLGYSVGGQHFLNNHFMFKILVRTSMCAALGQVCGLDGRPNCSFEAASGLNRRSGGVTMNFGRSSRCWGAGANTHTHMLLLEGLLSCVQTWRCLAEALMTLT